MGGLKRSSKRSKKTMPHTEQSHPAMQHPRLQQTLNQPNKDVLSNLKMRRRVVQYLTGPSPRAQNLLFNRNHRRLLEKHFILDRKASRLGHRVCPTETVILRAALRNCACHQSHQETYARTVPERLLQHRRHRDRTRYQLRLIYRLCPELLTPSTVQEHRVPRQFGTFLHPPRLHGRV
jgi:hypothetical protein